MKNTAKYASVLVILLSSSFMLLAPAFASVGDIVSVSPGRYSFYLDQSNETVVRLEYPRSAVLLDTAGDLLFNFTLRKACREVTIYIPPEFTGFTSLLRDGVWDTSKIWAGYTNNYRFIEVSKAGVVKTEYFAADPTLSWKDPIAPGWWKVTAKNATDAGIPQGKLLLRIFDVKAPDIVGRYFFKIFIDGASIGNRNFPTLVVEGDLDPAYISGRVLDADPLRYGQLIDLPNGFGGKVVAEGVTSKGRGVKAQAYFNNSATYTLYGLAPGTYNLTVQAAGYPPLRHSRLIKVFAAQSLQGVDLYLYPGVKITGTVFSKSVTGPTLWGTTYLLGVASPRPIRIEVTASSGEFIASTPWPFGEANYTDPSSDRFEFSIYRWVEFDGHVPQENATYTSGIRPGEYYLKIYVNGYVQVGLPLIRVGNATRQVSVPIDLRRGGSFNVTINFKDFPHAKTVSAVSSTDTHALVLEAYDEAGTLRGWSIVLVPPGSSRATLSLNGFFGLYPFRDIRDYGLASGTYLLKAFLTGYVQPEPLKASVSAGGAVTDISFPMVKGATLNVTLASIDWQKPPAERDWWFPGKNITVYFYDSRGEEYGYLTVPQPSGKRLACISFSGMDYYNLTRSMQPYYLGSHDNALPRNTYLVKAYTFGYLQKQLLSISAPEGGVADGLLRLVKGVSIEVKVIFKTEGIFAPVIVREGHTSIRVEVYDSLGRFVGANTSDVSVGQGLETLTVAGFLNYSGNPTARWVNYYDTTDGIPQRDSGLPADTYTIMAWVPGYEQRRAIKATLPPSGQSSVVFELDRLARLSGWVRRLSMYDEAKEVSWATVTAYSDRIVKTSSLDGFYEMWLPTGKAVLIVELIGYKKQTITACLSSGSDTPIDFMLE